MNKQIRPISALAATALLAACASIPAPSPVEVTRFHDAEALAGVQRGTVFVASAPGSKEDTLELAPYKAAVAAELAQLGFGEASSGDAQLVAEVSLDRYRIASDGARGGPVSVGVGGSTGSYGSGVGLGIGINLGGGGSSERLGTEMRVMLRDMASGQAVWEGRAQFTVSPKSDLAQAERNAQVVAEALFRGFPGNSGETIEIEVTE